MAKIIAEQNRLNWQDFYARMCQAGHDPQTRLAEQIGDHMAWIDLGNKKRT